MKLTPKQSEIATEIRLAEPDRPASCKFIENPRTSESWDDFNDYTRAIAVMIDAVDSMPTPEKMQEVFNEAWNKYTCLWGRTHDAVLRKIIGPKLNHVRQHPNGREIINRVLARVRSECGHIRPGLDVSQVDVTDILEELAE